MEILIMKNTVSEREIPFGLIMTIQNMGENQYT